MIIIPVKDGENIDRALKRFKKKFMKTGKMKEVIAELVQAMNAGPHSDGFIVVADNVTTTDGASSIQGNDQTVSAQYLSNDITSVAVVTN